jgi:uncharacterized protein with PQ loop repeat
MILTLLFAEVCHANGITGSGNLLRDCIYLKLYSTYPSCAQGICWKYWYSDGHIVLQLSACSCGEYRQASVGVNIPELRKSLFAPHNWNLFVFLQLQKQVIRTKSVQFMPFYLSLFSFLASLIWMIYGILGRDPYITVSMQSVFTIRKKSIFHHQNQTIAQARL